MNYRCITSIILNSLHVSYEIILADDCSTDKTKDCKSFFENIKHVPTETNLGFLKNCNNAARHAKGKYIVFLNNDTIVLKDWLSPMFDLVEQDEKIGMTGSMLIYPNGKLQEAGGIIWSDGSAWNYGRCANPQDPQYNYVREVDYISGASILIRKNLWEKIGGFDERYSPAYCEDSDLALTVKNLGYKVVYQPFSKVIHFEGVSHGKDTKAVNSVKAYQDLNNKKLFEKWEVVLKNSHLPNGVNVFKARDKSMNKRTILVIDHYVPTPDKDAGSVTTFKYIELFISMGLSVKFWGDNFINSEPYTAALQKMGVEVLFGKKFRHKWKEWVVDNRANIDYVYLNRPNISIKYIEFFKKNTKSKILYYGHDLHFLREQRRFEIEKDQQILHRVTTSLIMEKFIFSQADVVLTPNIDEQQIIKKIESSANAEVILPFFYNNRSVQVNNFKERKHILFVGGFSHSPNIDAVEWFVKEVFPEIKRKIQDVQFIVVGSNPTDNIKKLATDQIKILGYQTDEELKAIYNNIKIVVVPLRYGAGVKGKTIESMHKGIPLISTSIGVEGIPPVDSFIPVYDDAVSFADNVISLYSNEEKYYQQSEAQANYINNNFTEDVAKKIMSKILAITT